MRIAVIGTGISGLAAAWLLNRKHEVHVFEANKYVGGHARTVVVRGEAGDVALDTGFIVYNTTTYPNLVRLFDELGTATQSAEMSFSVHCERCDLEYSGTGASGLFAQKRNLVRPSFVRMLIDILRFNRLGNRLIESDKVPQLPLGVFLRKNSFGADFERHYLVPLASALLFSGAGLVGRFPAETLLRFFYNHGLLKARIHPKWRTVRGGSQTYVRAMISDYEQNIHTNSRVVSVARDGGEVRVGFAGGGVEAFDSVVMATHADQALTLLREPSERERELLSPWSYSASDTWLHTDSSFLPNRPAAVGACNYWLPDCTTPFGSVTVSYNLSRLLRIPGEETYLETLGPSEPPAEEHVIERLTFRHPIFTPESVGTQRQLNTLNDQQRTFYCGAYFGYGFHEDGLTSAMQVGEHFDISWP